MSVTKKEFLEKSLAFCAHHDLDDELRNAVITHRKYYYEQNYLFDDAAVLSLSLYHIILISIHVY